MQLERARPIGAMLAQRQRLLSSIQAQIAADPGAGEAAEQARAAAAARARLARQAALLKRAGSGRAGRCCGRGAAHDAPWCAVDHVLATTTVVTTTTAPATTTASASPTPAPVIPGGHRGGRSRSRIRCSVSVGRRGRPTGFDCSGLVLTSTPRSGSSLPHFAAAPVRSASPVAQDRASARRPRLLRRPRARRDLHRRRGSSCMRRTPATPSRPPRRPSSPAVTSAPANLIREATDLVPCASDEFLSKGTASNTNLVRLRRQPVHFAARTHSSSTAARSSPRAASSTYRW